MQVALTESLSPESLSRLPPGGVVAQLRGHVLAWLNDGSDHSVAQRTASTAFLIRVFSAGLIYATQVALARWLGSHEFGIYVYVWTWVLMFGDMADLGLATTAQRFIPQYRSNKALDVLRGFLSRSRWLAAG